MDDKDHKILTAVQEDARRSTREIAQRVKLPITTVHNRLRRLEEEKVIRGYHAEVDHSKLGKGVLAYIFLTVDYTKFKNCTQLEIKNKVSRIVNPEEAHIITGNFDIMLKMHFRTTQEISKTIEILRKIEGVDKTQTMIAIE